MEEQGYRKRLSGDGFESQESYVERISGILAVYAAILQTPTVTVHPHGLKHAWTWLARLLNMKAQDITATVLLIFLEIAGYRLQQAYGRQFFKCIIFIQEEFFKQLSTDSASRPAIVRLINFIKDINSKGKLLPPKGSELS